MIDVIYDHQIFWWQQHGGISRYFYELAKRVGSSAEFTASVIAPLYVNQYLRNGGVKVSGVHVPRIPRTRRMMAIANRSAASILLKLFRPTLVHETFFQVTSRAPKNCPAVITVHDMIHEKFVSTQAGSDRITAQKRAAVLRADKVICVSESTRADLINMFDPNPAKVTTIYHGFALNTSAGIVAPPKPDKPFFLYVGMRAGYKNFDRLLQTYSSSVRLSSAFNLYAFGDKPFTRSEKAAMQAAGLRENQVTHFSGDDALLRHLYTNATALVYPSLYEGFGIPPLEAMTIGCPVVCSNVSSIPEVVGEAGLYFDPTSIEAMREVMEHVASSNEVRADLIARGHERAKRFSYDRCAAKTMDVYREVA
jgi:glycosyltransferase involved in cell wall biosynthesis